MNATVKGATVSKTMWFAVALVIFSTMQTALPQLGAALHFDPATVAVMGTVVGLIVGWLRTQTTESLADKAAVPVPPPIP